MTKALHDLQVLLALFHGPRHGYAIITDVADRTGGRVVIGASSLYAIIRRLLRDTLVEDAGDMPTESKGPPRRYYRITEAGRDAARAETERLRSAVRAADAVIGEAVPELEES